jgi:hypothetical protein
MTPQARAALDRFSDVVASLDAAAGPGAEAALSGSGLPALSAQPEA